MGSLMSPIITNIILQNLEELAIEKLPTLTVLSSIYEWYTILAVSIEYLNDIQKNFNSLHDRLQFTMKVDNKRLSFLNTIIIVEDQKITFDRYQTAICFNRFLNFYLSHPLCHKKDIMFDIVDRIVRLSHSRFHKKNLTNAIYSFLNNGYPLSLIFSAIQERLKYHI